jgi:hypothetical protein
MKMKPGFVIKEVSDKLIVIPTGSVVINFRGIMTLNESGKRLFDLLQNEIELEEIIKEFERIYDVTYDIAKSDVEAFIHQLRSHNLIQ